MASKHNLNNLFLQRNTTSNLLTQGGFKMKRRMSLALVLTLIMTSIISMPLTWADETTPAVTTEAVTTAMEVIENRVDILTFNDFHGNVAEDVRDWGKKHRYGKNGGLCECT